jgi:hypothetical protein
MEEVDGSIVKSVLKPIDLNLATYYIYVTS